MLLTYWYFLCDNMLKQVIKCDLKKKIDLQPLNLRYIATLSVLVSINQIYIICKMFRLNKK